MVMSLRLPGLLSIVALAACTAARAPVTPRPPACPVELDAGDVFSREGVEGVFVLRDEATGCVQTTDAAMAVQGFRPQSIQDARVQRQASKKTGVFQHKQVAPAQPHGHRGMFRQRFLPKPRLLSAHDNSPGSTLRCYLNGAG